MQPVSPAGQASLWRSSTFWTPRISPIIRLPICSSRTLTPSWKTLRCRVVVETIGGTRFAYPYVKACLESGRSVCTSNKEMVATYGAELLGSGQGPQLRVPV